MRAERKRFHSVFVTDFQYSTVFSRVSQYTGRFYRSKYETNMDKFLQKKNLNISTISMIFFLDNFFFYKSPPPPIFPDSRT